MIPLLLGLHLAMAVAGPLVARRFGGRALLWAAAAPAATLVWALTAMPGLLDGDVLTQEIRWVPALDLVVTFRVDALSLLMVLLVSGIGTLVMVYAAGYFSAPATASKACRGLMTFAAAMLGLVTADNLLVLYVFWELTSVASYLLIGLDDTSRKARESAQHALLLTVGGGLGMLAGILLLVDASGTASLSGLLADPPIGDGTASIGFMLMLLGVLTKSAQVPFNGWLPGAMAAATPISTYLHSATMVKAGVYLAARLAPVAAGLAGGWRPVLMVLGALTFLHGAQRACRQDDLKLLLAHATVSQLGLMTLLLGAGVPELTYAGVAILLAHALYKAALFMVVGAVDVGMGTRDRRVLRDVRGRLPSMWVVGLVAGASLLGLPPMFGFVAKEVALDELLHVDPAGGLSVAVLVLGAIVTMVYGLRFLTGGFIGRDGASGPEDERAGAEPPAAAKAGRAPGLLMLAPPVIIGAASLLFGLFPGLVAPLVKAAALAADPAAEGKLVLWPGLKPALGLSLLSIALGVAAFMAWRRAESRVRLPALPDAADLFRSTVAGSVRGASAVTSVVQHGSQPLYLAVILGVAVVAPTVALLVGGPVAEGDLVLRTDVLQLVVAVLIAVAAIGVTVVRRRLTAVMLLGAVGYGMSVLFVMQGAPDLALTQLVIESLVVLVFVVVLRLLPREFSRPRTRLDRNLRGLIAVGVGGFVAVMLLLTGSVDHPTPVSADHLALALPEGGGRNVVNVILTDFRAFDTLGEVTVLLVAGFGVASLVAAGRKEGPRQVDLPTPQASLILTVGVRVAFPLTVTYALYLLFAGHNAPGGGFVGGLVAAAALMLRHIDGGTPALQRTVPAAPTALLGGGVALATATGFAGWIWGEQFLSSAKLEVVLPVLGTVKATSALIFDIGVFLAVVGLVMTLLQTLADDDGPLVRSGA